MAVEISAQKRQLVLGIDDAGRGPIIGPMVLAGVLLDRKHEQELKKLGVKDSKQVLPAKREKLFDEIVSRSLGHKIVLAAAIEIDAKITAGTNLNTIEAQKSAEIINALYPAIEGTEEEIDVIVDCPSPNTKSWKQTMMSFVQNRKGLNVSCEHKADVNHVACSAASILAKVTRDSEVEKIKKQIGKDFGSGYAADPITCKFLEEYSETHAKDGIFRQTWQTWKDVCAKKEQKNLNNFGK